MNDVFLGVGRMGEWSVGEGGFRASHDQRLAAGPRQGHLVLDPGKMHSHFSAFDGGMIVLFTERMNVCEKV